MICFAPIKFAEETNSVPSSSYLLHPGPSHVPPPKYGFLKSCRKRWRHERIIFLYENLPFGEKIIANLAKNVAGNSLSWHFGETQKRYFHFHKPAKIIKVISGHQIIHSVCSGGVGPKRHWKTHMRFFKRGHSCARAPAVLCRAIWTFAITFPLHPVLSDIASFELHHNKLSSTPCLNSVENTKSHFRRFVVITHRWIKYIHNVAMLKFHCIDGAQICGLFVFKPSWWRPLKYLNNTTTGWWVV